MLLLLAIVTMGGLANPKGELPYSVKGVLVDSVTNEGEPYSTIRIALKSNVQKPVKLNVTGLNGQFSESLATPGTYIITFTSVGKNTIMREFMLSESKKHVDLGRVMISESAEMLKGVEVVAAKPLVKSDIDKIEYNIKDDPESQTNTMLEMLRKVPLVTVDGEDKIQVNGSSNFAVHVNNKPNSMLTKNPSDILKNMPASSIKKIEVITDPGAKYDAEGLSGILNIVTDDNSKMQGYNVTLRGNAGNLRSGTSAYGTVQVGKFTVTGNYSFNYNSSDDSYAHTERETFDNDAFKYLKSDSKSSGHGNFQYGELEGSYEVDSLNLISFSAGLWGYNFRNYSTGNTLMQNSVFENVYSFNTDAKNKNSNTNLDLGFDYQRSFKSHKDKMLTFSYRLSHNPGESDSYSYYKDVENYPYTLRDLYYNGDRTSDEHTFQLDYTTPIGKLHTVSSGVKYILRLNNTATDNYYDNGDQKGFVYDETSSTDLKQHYDIFAAYGEYKLKFKKYSAKAGLRYEYSMMGIDYRKGEEEDFDTHFNDLIPSASLGWKINDKQNLNFSYNMRISRPNIYYLNPYVNKNDPTNISYGNPDLDSEKSHSLNLRFGSFTPKFTMNVNANYRFINNSIERYTFMEKDETGNSVQYSTFNNIGKFKSFSLSTYLNWSMTKTTRFNANIGARYTDYRSDEMGLHNSGWNANFWGGVQQTLPAKIKLNLNAGGMTPNISLQGKGFSYYFYSINVNRSFLKEDRLNVSAYAQCPFTHYLTYKQTTTTENFKTASRYKQNQRSFGISVSYRLGKLQARVKKAERSIENDDVKGGGEGGSGGGGGTPQ